jgi:hypothetical protein
MSRLRRTTTGTTRTGTTGRTKGAALAAALVVLLLAGCGGAGDEGGGGDQEAAAPAAGGDAGGSDGGAGGGTDEGSGGGDSDGDGSAVTVPERKITRSEVTVEVDDLSRSAQQVRDLAAANGGEVTDESLGLSQAAGAFDEAYGSQGVDVEGVPVGPAVVALPGEARLVLRVPPDAAAETVDEIAELGTETGRWTSSTSVETTLVDLESRIDSQTRAVEQAQELMDRATSLSDIVMLENEVNSRTAELESLKARQASIAGQSERATVTAVLRTRERAEEVEAGSGFLGGLDAGWRALQASVGVLLTILGAVLPFAVVALLVGWPVRLLVRRWRANRADRPVLAPAGPPLGWATGPAPSAQAAPPASPGQQPGRRPDGDGPPKQG